ncbi:Pentatricopeptide repeat [Macleaya cordata]|uniref:Pentatricopeptide repeat n=1 Tax=Macleaya cordata TaxID=56857 RepID=A0A200QEG4_MACCD|nr:Pentatricopeptide repeat [Macleaya cordata]
MLDMAENPSRSGVVAPVVPSKLLSHGSSSSQIPSASPQAKILLEILFTVPVLELESALTRTGIPPAPEYIEEVLKLCYGSPAAAVRFFRWAGLALKPTSYSWNLIVDILGKNRLFEPMWDAIRSMKEEGLLSVATFASVFGSYCIAEKINEAIMSFDVMNQYGVQQDVVAVNSLLSAMCREDNQTLMAYNFFERIKTKVPPDADTFAILLEGWEKEGNVAKAKSTFGEMVVRVGWSPQNMSAYDAFLTTLVQGSQTDEAITLLKVMKGKNCLPGMKFFSNALNILIKQNDSSHALSLWDIMVGSGLLPNLIMYNEMIGLLCNHNDIDAAFRLLDEMVFHGTFPDSFSYNIIFQCMIKNKRVRLATSFFTEMLKNEQPPTHGNCTAAIKMFFEFEDPQSATNIWNHMVENDVKPIDDAANALLIGLRNMGRLTEVKRFVDDMLDRRIIISESTMAKLRNAFYKEGRSERDTYDRLAKRWKQM